MHSMNLISFKGLLFVSVGFDGHPQTDDLWFTNNGRDWVGDDRWMFWC